ncbi:MAG: hypothetical protein MUP76_02035 [Acidimicrobiia bacterium]|nr:hypothetical protein [Acidimicrobiia bacterium]
MRYLRPLAVATVALALAGCGGDAVDTGGCEYLFGAPGVATGLDASSCRPERACDGSEPFIPPDYGPAAIAALRSRTLIDPPSPLGGDPYDDPSLVPAGIGGVCAVFADPSTPGGYRLETVPDRESAEATGGVITHAGACGACSSLQDLAVYLETPDLGGPVRECALIDFGDNPQATQDCILALGFTRPCAQIWAYNSFNTREACLVDCLEALNQPSHLPDGSLNACLACDEANSGPVFKAVAGRTRRNSGIPSAICRPGDDVAAVYHDDYP